ncbi:sorting nexin-17-like isoform X2 [Homarus americanus]|uniref:sorting nexin-17-like isoform X2 n=1 Tax=Homarus americanus TaxID=6706 RepID=UPI001C45A051|nr:sorting nexin-17-like isoform X2 [Homarus americanus]
MAGTHVNKPEPGEVIAQQETFSLPYSRPHYCRCEEAGVKTNMHFSIPDTQECKEDNGSTYVAYNIHINGVFHCTVRYRQLYSLHEQLRKDLGGSTLPSFPPKKLLPLSPTQTEERRVSLEKYILQLSQDPRVLNNDVFNGFLVSAQNETQRVGGGQDEVPIDIYMMSGQKVTLSVPATLQTDDLLEKVCSHIHLPNELVYYFALFLVKKEENDLIVVKRLQDFESPYISQRCVKGMHRIVLRKNFWDPSIDLDVMGDRVGLNLLYAQTVQDVERGWILTNREIQRQLAALQAKGAKREYLELARTLKYYGYLQFQQCTCDFPKPGTPVLISAGNRELNFRIECEDGTVKEGNFKVTRMRCWRITVQQPVEGSSSSNSISTTSNNSSNTNSTSSSNSSSSRSSCSSLEGGRHVNLELSFEYLMSREDMRWVTVTSCQAVLMSMCLQGMVQELLTHKRGHKVRTPSERVRKGSLSYMRRDGSSTQVTLNHTGESLPMDGATQSPIVISPLAGIFSPRNFPIAAGNN